MQTQELSGKLYAGAAKSEITNCEPDVMVNDPLYAKALVLDDGKTKVVIITMDVTAIGGRKISQGMLPDVGEDFLPNLRERLECELKIPGCNVLANASHTHPPGRMLCSDDEPFIPDLIEVGVDILNPVQPECMSFEKIHAEYGSVLSFWGTIGTQTTMPFGKPEEVRSEVLRNLKIAGKNGGLLCTPTHLVEPEVPWANIEAYLHACHEFKL